MMANSLQIKHFAGPVQYTVNDWLLKNNDPLPETLPSIFASASNPLSATIFKADQVQTFHPDDHIGDVFVGG